LTAETLLLEQGWPSALVAKWQGHTTEVSYRHYVAANDDLAEAAASELDMLVAGRTHGQAMDKASDSDAG
jgi:hypothetical protein